MTFTDSNNTESADISLDENPFKIPSDQEIFLIRLKERENKQKERKQRKRLKIWQRPTKNQNRKQRVRFHSSIKSKKVKPSHAVLGERRREKENMSDFIDKKREMFLVQMSLDTKRDEIRKLEEKAQMREQALLKSELMLEEDALRFDAFLKENDIKAHEAIKRHEKEVKEKQQKIVEIKKLNQEIAKVKSEMDKYNETLAYCRKYKKFLDDLTPKEWFTEQQSIKQKREKAIEEWHKDNNNRLSRNQARKKKIDNGEENVDPQSPSPSPPSPPPPPPPVIEEDEMHFKHPEQLLEIFAALEERNLFLIQNAQETEEALDELKSKFQEAKNHMESKTNELENSIQQMKGKIKIQEEKANKLQQRAKALGASGDNKQQKLLNELGHKVANVFAECGFDPEQTPDTLGKLAKIEQLLENLIGKLEEMPEIERKKAEKRKESERRDRLRREKVEKMEAEYEDRLKRSLERAKRVEERVKQQKKGKPKMFRSAPIKKKKQKQNSIDKKQLEQQKLFKKFFT